MFYVYVLKSERDGRLYTGYTTDLRRRFSEHNKKLSQSTKYRTPFELLYYEAYRPQIDAKLREKRLKLSAGARTALKRRLTNSVR
jgi:putative endonuclease